MINANYFEQQKSLRARSRNDRDIEPEPKVERKKLRSSYGYGCQLTNPMVSSLLNQRDCLLISFDNIRLFTFEMRLPTS